MSLLVLENVPAAKVTIRAKSDRYYPSESNQARNLLSRELPHENLCNHDTNQYFKVSPLAT